MKLFRELNLKQNIQAALDKLGFTEPTEIQAKAIPILLEQDVDFHGQAQTGTGKTLAFGIPLIQRLNPESKKVQALIVAPTRELVLQICESIKNITSNSNISICPIYGGVSIIKQMGDLRRGPQIIVGTPGRLNDHLRRKTLILKDLEILVLDEADIMLDMGFKEEIDEILDFAPKNRNIWLFSATVKPGINDIKNNHMKNIVNIQVSKNNVGTTNTTQYYCVVSNVNRLNTLRRIIDSDPEFYGFIFCPTKALTSDIYEKLIASGYNINCLHGDMNQSLRTKVINQFKQKKFTILLATDVAARGIDVADITHVVNYYLPNDQENYVHRIGRTGRAGKTGVAITFVNNSEIRKIKSLAYKFNVDIKPMEIPSIENIIDIQAKRVQEQTSKLSQKPIGKYANRMLKLLEQYSIEEIKNILSNLLDEKFFKNIDNSDKIEKTDNREKFDNRSNYRDNNLVELEIDLGSNDHVTQKDILELLVNKAKIQKNELSKIKILRKKSFVVLPAHRADIIPLLKNERLNGKRARIFLAR